MNLITTGILAGIAAMPAWMIVNLFVDFFYLPVIRRHSDKMNSDLMSRPALNFLVLSGDLILWGAIFGAGYGLLYPGLERFGWVGGIVWGVIMFVSFSRSNFESGLWTTFPKDLNWFWFFEALAGLVAWGAAFGFVFSRLV